MDQVFQSAPGGEAGGDAATTAELTRTRRFQSAPGGEAGGDVAGTPSVEPATTVSIRPRR